LIIEIKKLQLYKLQLNGHSMNALDS